MLVSLFLCSQGFALILVDDFTASSLPLNITDTTADGNFVTSPLDSATGTLFGHRYAYVYLDNGPGSVNAQITSGVARITTTPTATGRFYLYHDSVFGGPYVDVSAEYAGGGVSMAFATPVGGSPSVTLALQSTTGRLLGSFSISDGLSQFHAPFSAFSVTGTFTPSTVFETRIFFTDIGPSTQLNIDSISIVPEPTTLALLSISGLTLFLRRMKRLTMRGTEQPLRRPFERRGSS